MLLHFRVVERVVNEGMVNVEDLKSLMAICECYESKELDLKCLVLDVVGLVVLKDLELDYCYSNQV